MDYPQNYGEELADKIADTISTSEWICSLSASEYRALAHDLHIEDITDEIEYHECSLTNPGCIGHGMFDAVVDISADLPI